MIKYLKIYRTILKHFGFQARPLATFSLLQLHRLINASTRGLDHLIYPGFRKVQNDRPIFILGNPRSGTTFMHRFLLNSGELAALELWEMLAPAITARKLLGGLVERLAGISPARYHSSEAHETSLRDVETDDAMAFFHFVDGGFRWSYFDAWEDTFGSEASLSALNGSGDPAKTERYFRYMDACWRRNLAAKNKERSIIKSSMLTLQAETLLERYPQAKIIYMVRDPLATIPSGMSLITGVMDRSYDIFNATSEQARGRYLENLYGASCHLYRSFHDLRQRGGAPDDRCMVVTFPDIMQNLEQTMIRVVDFAGLEPQNGFWQKVATQAEKQRGHKSAHKYSLEKYNLTEERIRSDLGFVYDAYNVA